MDLIADEGTQAAIHELVPRQRPLALEFCGYDQCLEVRIVVAHDPDNRVVEAIFY